MVKEGQGFSFNVSDFLSGVGGCLALDDEKRLQHPSLPAEAFVVMHPGFKHDGLWEAKDLLKQVKERAIAFLKALFSRKASLVCA